MTRTTQYTHRARIVGIRGPTKGKQYWTELRKVGKWWETRQERRRFDSTGAQNGCNHEYAQYMLWRLEIETLKRIK